MLIKLNLQMLYDLFYRLNNYSKYSPDKKFKNTRKMAKKIIFCMVGF